MSSVEEADSSNEGKKPDVGLDKRGSSFFEQGARDTVGNLIDSIDDDATPKFGRKNSVVNNSRPRGSAMIINANSQSVTGLKLDKVAHDSLPKGSLYGSKPTLANNASTLNTIFGSTSKSTTKKRGFAIFLRYSFERRSGKKCCY